MDRFAFHSMLINQLPFIARLSTTRYRKRKQHSEKESDAAKTPAQRKEEQRKRDREHCESVGATLFTMDMYQGTTDALNRIMEAGGFEQGAEAITLMIHNIDKLIDSDKSRFNELTSIVRSNGNE